MLPFALEGRCTRATETMARRGVGSKRKQSVRGRRPGGGGGRSAKKAKRPSASCPWSEMKKPQLAAACKRRGLPHGGRKRELVERLREYVLSGASKAAASAAAAAALAGSAYDMFDVEDDANDAAMAEAAANVESSLPDKKPPASDSIGGTIPGKREMAITAKMTSTDAKLGLTLQPAATDTAGLLVKAVIPGSIFANTELKAGMVIRRVNGVKFQTIKEAVGLFQQAGQTLVVSVDEPELPAISTAGFAAASSLSQSSQTSATSASLPLSQTSATSETKRELTKEQKERMKRMREEARKKRMARLSNGSVASSVSMSQSPQSSQGSLCPRPPCSPANPYAKAKKEEVFDALPPVREESRNKLSDEQLAVIMTARPPTVVEEPAEPEANAMPRMTRGQRPHMVRVNAAAGTGKTTTLIHLATRCIDLGHESVNYVTYSKASATDAKERMQAQLSDGHKHRVDASTMHSCAMSLLQNQPLEGEDRRVYDDNAFQTFIIREHWGKALGSWVQPAINHITNAATTDKAKRALASGERLLFDKAVYYVWKAFGHFCKSKLSVEELKDPNNENRHYYPGTMHYFF